MCLVLSKRATRGVSIGFWELERDPLLRLNQKKTGG